MSKLRDLLFFFFVCTAFIACSDNPVDGWQTEEEAVRGDAGGDASSNGADAGTGGPSNPAPLPVSDAGPATDLGAGDGGFTSDGTTGDGGSGPDPDGGSGPDGRGDAGTGNSCQSTLDCEPGLECTDQTMDVFTCEEMSCFCNDPDSYCTNGTCALANRNCVLEGCPDNFSCSETVCLCDDPDLCSSGCSVDKDCSWDQICDAGSCVDALCESDSECPTGYVCGGSSSRRLCREQGTGQVGDDCYNHSECATGYCYAGVTCVEPCLTNADCPSSRECASPDHFDLFVPYCRAPECGTCNSNEFCRAPTYLDNSWSCTSEDACPDGDCSVPFDE